MIAFDDSEMRNLPPVLLAQSPMAHFEPSALLSVLAPTRTWVGFGGFGPFGSLFGLRVPRVRITVRPGLEARGSDVLHLLQSSRFLAAHT